ncbi:MAG: T9SS type A sorting domain-containing protein [Bacteroidota bacterium]
MMAHTMIFAFVITGYSCLAQGPFNIGTIHAGDSIVIYYDATINNPLVPANATSISNRGTVSGSNFSNVLTDDPDSGPADATITLLNAFPLPVTLTELKAKEAGNSIILNWKVVTEFDMAGYEIEKSSDGTSFIKIGEVAARNSSGILQYQFTDNQPLNGNNFYRLRMLNLNGTQKYSMVIRVRLGNTLQAVHVFPNPVYTASVNVQMENMAAGPYTVRLYNSLGQAVMTKQLNYAGGSSTEIIYFSQKLSKGIYQLEIGNGQKRNTFRLVYQ